VHVDPDDAAGAARLAQRDLAQDARESSSRVAGVADAAGWASLPARQRLLEPGAVALGEGEQPAGSASVSSSRRAGLIASPSAS
jgi:hypothetical protein